MNWINNVVRPKIRSFLTTKREVPDNMWVKCPETGQMVFYKDLEANQFVVPGSNFHMRMASELRLHNCSMAATTARLGSGRPPRSAEVPRRAPLHRPAERRQGRDQAR